MCPRRVHGVSTGRHTDRVWSSEAAEIIALDIYQWCDEAGERITLGMCERRLTELLSHPDGHCGLCKAARKVSAEKAFWVASSWQSGVAAARRLMR